MPESDAETDSYIRRSFTCIAFLQPDCTRASTGVRCPRAEPEIQLKVSLGLPGDLIKQFEENNLDCLIVPASGLPSFGERVFLREEYFNLVVPISAEIPLNDDGRIAISFFEQWPT